MKNKKYVIRFPISLFIWWSLVYLAFIESSIFAQNLILFFIWFIGSLSCIGMCTPEGKIIMLEKARTYSKLRLSLGTVSDVLSVAVFAAFGWFFTALLWAVVNLMKFNIIEKYLKE